MKKLLLTTALVASTVATSAHAESGFFAGVYGGFTSVTNKIEGFAVQDLNNINPDNLEWLRTNDAGGQGGQGGLQLGYEHLFEGGFVAALDLFAQFGSATGEGRDQTQAGDIITVSHKQKYALGVAARLGYMFDTTLAYFKIGYSHSRFDVGIAQFANNPASVPAVTQKMNHNGLVVGIGADMPVGEMITVGFSYDFTIYNKKTYAQAYANAQNNDIVATLRPRTHAINVVLKYKF